MIQSDLESRLVTLDADQRMEPSFQQTTRFPHQLTGKEQATGHAVPARLFLGASQLNEGFGSGMFDQEFSDDLCSVVGHGRFSVGFVEHFVETLRAERPLHQISKGYGCCDKFLRDTYPTCNRGGWTNDGHGCSAAPVVSSRHG